MSPWYLFYSINIYEHYFHHLHLPHPSQCGSPMWNQVLLDCLGWINFLQKETKCLWEKNGPFSEGSVSGRWSLETDFSGRTWAGRDWQWMDLLQVWATISDLLESWGDATQPPSPQRVGGDAGSKGGVWRPQAGGDALRQQPPQEGSSCIHPCRVWGEGGDSKNWGGCDKMPPFLALAPRKSLSASPWSH